MRDDELEAGSALRAAVADDDEREADALAAIGSLPRVTSIGVVMTPTRVEAKAPPPTKKANVGLVLKPYVPQPKRTMVTMSDMSGTGGARGGVSPARNPRKD